MNKKDYISKYDYESVKAFFKQFDNSVLTEQEEKALLLNKDNIQARNMLVEHNMRLVRNVALCYTGTSMTLEDLIQEGTIALMKTIDYFDINRGYKLSTLATKYINNYIIRAIDNKADIIRKPIYLKEKIYKYKKAKEELQSKINIPLNIDQFAYLLNMSVLDVIKFETLMQEYKSLNFEYKNTHLNIAGEEVYDDFHEQYQNLEIDNSYNPEQNYEQYDLNTRLNDIIKSLKLSPLEFDILNGKIINDSHTLDYYAHKYHLSKEYIRIVKNDMLIRLRCLGKTKSLIEYAINEKEAMNTIKRARIEKYKRK